MHDITTKHRGTSPAKAVQASLNSRERYDKSSVSTYPVPAEQWISFCRAFARDHSGEPISLEIVESADHPPDQATERTAPSAEAAELLNRQGTLLTMYCDPGADYPKIPMIVINVKSLSGQAASHVVLDPVRLVLEQPTKGNGRVQIETDGDVTWFVQLSARVSRSLLDGLK